VMSPEARELMRYMSDLSEEGYYAGWMQSLEYDLWDAVASGPRKYGFLDITEQHISKLVELSAKCGGWIIFDDVHEETFLPMDEWLQMFNANQQKVSKT